MRRKLSWTLALLAYTGPPAWAYFALAADRQAQLASHGWVCGNPMLGIMFLAAISSTALSAGATALAFGALPEQPGGRRLIEIFVLAVPAIAGAGLAALLFF